MSILPGAWSDHAQRVRGYWNQDIWIREHLPSGAPRPVGRAVILLSRTLYVIASGCARERLRTQAAALTYTSLLSLVPALAVVFSLFTAFGGLEDVGRRLEELVLEALAVRQQGPVQEYLDRFIDGANAGQLGAIGTIFLFFTVLALLSDVERSFNDIWGVTRGRSFLQRMQVYWPLLTVGPILMGLSFSFTAAVAASEVVQSVEDALLGFRVVGNLASYILICLFFAFVYQIVPNTSVRWSSALVGGLVGGSLWLLAQKLYAVFAARAIAYSAIYGSLSVIPLFIIWVFLSWLVALLGAATTFAVQSAKTFEPERPINQAERERVAVELALAVAMRYRSDQGPMPSQDLIDQAGVPPRVGRNVLEVLVDGGLLAEARMKEEMGYLPARPLDHVTVADVIRALRELPSEPSSITREPGVYARVADELIGRAEATAREVYEQQSLDSLSASLLDSGRG